ncbi:AbrB/MazE/SpoVT family DNA-binding domain-containing protein [Paenibacillus sp. IB182496]|uniref:AbrB/MazE/SpoVT family DNA-binding domain-containing protein n=2 Tax=Paenibacillus sabuli TaxID=2772509 RepID=A0A927GU78_9BACL|nr:AbrB/MazE/SpoVT family DNA-binding domain-containing protein [Paenibacillus sabuli]
MMTTAILSKWGNSSAVRIPNQVLKRLNLSEGEEIEIIVTADNELLLRPLSKYQESQISLRAHLSQLLAQVKTDVRHEEVDLGIEGDEII